MQLALEIAKLELKSRDELQALWREYFKTDCNVQSREFYIARLAHRMQELAYGGLSIALADGQAHGLPCIGFADAPSVNEVIVDGVNGFLAKDVEENKKKMAILMKDKDLRIKMGQEAVKTVERYAENHMADDWEALLHRLTGK